VQGRYWGTLGLTFDTGMLLRESGIAAGGGGQALAVHDSAGLLLGGDPAVLLAGPVVYEIVLPGETWRISAIPAGGWEAAIRGHWRLYQWAGLLLAGLSAWIFTALGSSRQRLVETVAQRTAALTAELQKRRRAEQEAEQSSARFRTMVDASPIWIFLSNPDGEGTYSNPALRRMTGVDRPQLTGWAWLETIHPEERERFKAEFLGALRAAASYTGTGRFVRPDGSIVWWEARTAQVYSGEELVGHVGLVVDITERQASEEALRKYSERLAILNLIEREVLELTSPQDIGRRVLRRPSNFVR
jgi:PAS domain S-box-containing protein